MERRLEAFTNVVLSGVAIMVAVMLVARYQAASSATPVGYEKGETVPAVEGANFGQHERNVLLFVRSTCQFCTASMGFYRTLLQQRDHAAANVGIVALSTEDVDTSRAYLVSHDVHPDAVVSVRPGELLIPGTPYMVLVDSTGKVVDSWLGQIPTATEEEVLKSVVTQS